MTSCFAFQSYHALHYKVKSLAPQMGRAWSLRFRLGYRLNALRAAELSTRRLATNQAMMRNASTWITALSAGDGVRKRALARSAQMARSRTMALRAVISSRLVVLAAGTAGALLVTRTPRWYLYDPQRVSSHLGSVGDVLGATAVRWDAIHYLWIAQHGYTTHSDTIYFPLYPLLIHVVALLTQSYVVAGLLISVVSFSCGLALLHRLTDGELGRKAADATVLLLAFAPLSFFFTAIYTESLFLVLSVGAFYAARRGHWAVAGILAALLSITRIPGILILLPIGWLYLRRGRRIDRSVVWLLLAPCTLGLFLAYLAARGYGWLAPITNQTGPEHLHQLGGPLSGLVSAAKAAVHGTIAIAHGTNVFAPWILGPFSLQFESVLLFSVLIIAIAATVLAFRHLPAAYGIYSACVLFVSVYSPTTGQPLQSLDRYTLVIFPLWMAGAALLARHHVTWLILILSGCLLAFYSFEAATWVFIA